MKRMMLLQISFWIFIVGVSALPIETQSASCSALLPQVTILYRSIESLLKDMTERDNVPIDMLRTTNRHNRHNRCINQHFELQKKAMQILPKVIYEIEIFMEYLKEEEVKKTSRWEVKYDFSNIITNTILKPVENVKMLLKYDVKILKQDENAGKHFKLEERCALRNLLMVKNYAHDIKQQLTTC